MAQQADGSPAVSEHAPDFATIFREHLPRVWRMLRSLGVSPADVEDVAQEVFVVVHRKLPEFEGRSSLTTWLYGICWRTCRDHQRRAYKRRERVTDEVPDPGAPADQEEAVQNEQALAELKALLDELDEEKRAVFVLYEVEGLVMKDIVEILDCPLQTGYSRLRAARAEVKQAWEKRHAEDEGTRRDGSSG